MLKRAVAVARLLAGFDTAVYRQDFDGCAGTYDRVITRPLLADATGRALAAAGLRPGMTCLDLGCGTGQSTAAILDLVRPGGRVTGCDFSPGMLAVARKRLDGPPDLTFVESDVFDFLVAQPGDSADFIGSFWSMEYVSHARLLKEMRRVLRPGGTVCVLVNLRHSLKEVQELVAPIILRRPLSLRRIPPLNFLGTVGEFGGVAEAAGLVALHLNEEIAPCSFPAGTDMVSWMKDGGPAAGFRGSLREACRDRIFSMIEQETDRRGGMTTAFRYVHYRGRR